jgi:hypothetical protein
MRRLAQPSARPRLDDPHEPRRRGTLYSAQPKTLLGS